MLIVTMTTVGFGDFVPKSLTARAFTTVIAVIGIFLMALCISLVHESLQLTQQEKRILAYTENTGECCPIPILRCGYVTISDKKSIGKSTSSAISLKLSSFCAF